MPNPSDKMTSEHKTLPVLVAAEYLCQLSNWMLTPLKLQKLLYLGQMYHLVYHESPLIDRRFEAWIYGPVQPSLYYALRHFRNKPITKIPFEFRSSIIVEGTHRAVLDYVYQTYGHLNVSDLIRLTHGDGGGWARNWDEKDPLSSSVIPYEHMKEEFQLLRIESSDA